MVGWFEGSYVGSSDLASGISHFLASGVQGGGHQPSPPELLSGSVREEIRRLCTFNNLAIAERGTNKTLPPTKPARIISGAPAAVSRTRGKETVVRVARSAYAVSRSWARTASCASSRS